MPSNSFIERSIVGCLTFLKDSIFAEEYALKHGFWQSLDPRIKIITCLLFILQALFTGKMVVLFLLYALCLFLVVVSKIDLGFFLKRTWIFIPLFSLFIALPAIFGQGQVLFTWHILGAKIMISRQGIYAASIFVTRVITCVSFVVLLNITTRHFDLLKVLRIFKIPQIFVTTLGMCYRYVYLFIGIIQNTYLAIKSRVGLGVQYRPGQHLVAWNIVSLWNYSEALNEEAYKAMVSRGYQGENLAWNDFKIRARDWAWLFTVILMILIIWII